MPVDTQHSEYALMRPVWDYMRAVAGGQRTVHAAGEVLLPKLSGESQENYDKRRARALFFNATWRTIEGLSGMMFRKAPVVEVSPATLPMLDDVTKSGVDFDSFARQCDTELMTVGRVGILVDYPPAPVAAGSISVQAAERLNLRPNMAMYVAESVINWDTRWINNRTVLTLIVLAESATVRSPTDEFMKATEPRWRVLDLVEVDGALVYRQRVFAKLSGADTLVEGPTFPRMGGQLMEFIPFRVLGTEDNTPGVSDPPLLDLAYVNVSHYQTTADLEHGAHKTSLPQPWIAGIDNTLDEKGVPIKNPTMYMGGGDIWTFRNPETMCGMLEYTGAGLQSLETRRESKEAQMAVLGARMLEEQKSGVEAAETAGIHRSGEQATLASLARMLSKGIKEALGWFDEWAGGSGEVEYLINQKFFASEMSPQMLAELVAAWQQGAISKEAMFEKLQAGEIVSDERDFEDEESKIDQAPPTLAAQAVAPPEDPNAPEPKPGDEGKPAAT